MHSEDWPDWLDAQVDLSLRSVRMALISFVLSCSNIEMEWQTVWILIRLLLGAVWSGSILFVHENLSKYLELIQCLFMFMIVASCYIKVFIQSIYNKGWNLEEKWKKKWNILILVFLYLPLLHLVYHEQLKQASFCMATILTFFREVNFYCLKNITV